jgi:hypothetical protein
MTRTRQTRARQGPKFQMNEWERRMSDPPPSRVSPNPPPPPKKNAGNQKDAAAPMLTIYGKVMCAWPVCNCTVTPTLIQDKKKDPGRPEPLAFRAQQRNKTKDLI